MERDDDEITDESTETEQSSLRRGLTHGLVAVVLIAIGVAGGLLWAWRPMPSGAPPRDGVSDTATMELPPRPWSEPSVPAMRGRQGASVQEAVEVVLMPDAVERAGMKTAVARSANVTTSISVPGTVAPNAYRETRVNALVGGIVRQVSAELGTTVARGDRLAVIFSTELADAQMKYLTARAMLAADHQKLIRTEKLVRLGAVSRQELEEVTAVHAAHETEVAAARQRLALLDLSPNAIADLVDASHVVSEVSTLSPADGIVIARAVNPGQVVSAAQDLFTVADLRSVWVIGDLYEKDFPAVRLGSRATITVPSRAPTRLQGRVAYIDPRLDTGTRTAKVRIEVPNAAMALRLGMYVTVTFETSSEQRVTLVPREAVQAIGERTVVYVPVSGDDGRFIERAITPGRQVDDAVEVLGGLKPGERVVVEGAFVLRAEAQKKEGGGEHHHD